MRKIEEGDNDEAHIDAEAPKVLKFKHANDDHQEKMVGKVLTNDKGICH